jgi:hypothetical protein
VFSFLQDIMQIVKINSKKFLVISVFLLLPTLLCMVSCVVKQLN